MGAALATNTSRDLMLSPHVHRRGVGEEQEAGEVAKCTFEVNLMVAGVEDDDITSLRRNEGRLLAKMKERLVPSNMRTRA
jgi:hypothetical protein